jgi:hypothetical protein
VTVAIEPTNITGFTDGVWTGEVRVLETTTGMWIHVTGTNAAWFANSNPFAVLDYHFVLNNAQPVENSDDVIIQWESGSNQTYTIRSSTNLTSGFSVLATNIAATPPLNSYTVTAASAENHFFGVEEE